MWPPHLHSCLNWVLEYPITAAHCSYYISNTNKHQVTVINMPKLMLWGGEDGGRMHWIDEADLCTHRRQITYTQCFRKHFSWKEQNSFNLDTAASFMCQLSSDLTMHKVFSLVCVVLMSVSLVFWCIPEIAVLILCILHWAVLSCWVEWSRMPSCPSSRPSIVLTGLTHKNICN